MNHRDLTLLLILHWQGGLEFWPGDESQLDESYKKLEAAGLLKGPCHLSDKGWDFVDMLESLVPRGKYRVCLTRDVSESVFVEVDAGSKDEAEAKVLAHPPVSGWEPDDPQPSWSEVYASDTELLYGDDDE